MTESTKPDYEAMRQELEDAGYKIHYNDSESYATATTPDGEWECIDFPETPVNVPLRTVQENIRVSIETVIEKAHAHYLEQKELAALRDFKAEIDTQARRLLDALQARPFDHDAYHTIRTECDFDFWNKQMDRLKKQE